LRGYLEDSRSILRIRNELSREYIYWIRSLRRNHECGGKVRAYWRDVRRTRGLNFESSKIWVWEDDAFRHQRVDPSIVDWMTLVDQADRWDFVIWSRSVRKIPIN
jgi:hypothetical protein